MIDIRHGDCLQLLPEIPTASADAVITDPPYPCIRRSYGYWTEAEWFALMNPVVEQCRRILKPTGSAVFILQPNSERVGRMRTWLWEFMLKWGREWGIVQDAYWWNYVAQPTVHCGRTNGLMRPSVKCCLWLGLSDCYRNQDAVLWTESIHNKAIRESARCTNRLERKPSGYTCRKLRQLSANTERGGVTPYNLMPVSNTGGYQTAGIHGHGAGTPLTLLRWWTRYICPPDGLIVDPFVGSGTTCLAAITEGRSCIGLERDEGYVTIARKRVAEALAKEREQTPLFAAVNGAEGDG